MAYYYPLVARAVFGRRGIAMLLGLTAAFWLTGVTTNAQPAVTIKNGKTFIAGSINILVEIPGIETTAFTCTSVATFKKGEKVAGLIEVAKNGKNILWSASTHSFRIGTKQLAYPIMAIGSGHTALAAIVNAKIDIKASEKVRMDGYEIETERAVSAGESIPALYILGHNNVALLSLEVSRDGKPVFASFTDEMDFDSRADAIKFWQQEHEHVDPWAEPKKVPR